MTPLAIITGGTKGIGRAVSERFLAEGYSVLATYAKDTKKAREFELELNNRYPNKLKTIQADSCDLSSIQIINDYLEQNELYVNSLIINAGITYRSSFEEMKIEEWKNVFEANVHYPVFLIQQLLPRLQKNSSITLTGSAMGIYPHAQSLAYGVSKSAVHAIIKNMVKFLKPASIRINGVAPGFVETEWHKTKPEEIRKNIYKKIAAGRFCEPTELAGAYFMLANNPYINAEIITVDGGYSFE